MAEKIILSSAVINIPIGVEDKEDPSKVEDFVLHVDISDKALKDYSKKQQETLAVIESIQEKYAEAIGDEEISDENLEQLVAGIEEMLEARFDADFGSGIYKKISASGGGNSFINMLALYEQVSEHVDKEIQKRIGKIQLQSKNKQAKYLKNRKK
ncbi:hypothetical protein [Enterococcus diestrammenae]|uniref:hypothetical protein n=1 Tax=Enterococcus diestrammenae TaxID=1155073 RepID=UPI0022E94E71|nr:hypothetical protein [Enterococcus diestrammenae]